MTRRIFSLVNSVDGYEVGLGSDRVEVIDSSGNLNLLASVTTETSTTLSTAVDMSTGTWRMYLTSAGEICILSTGGVQVMSTS